MGPRRLPPRCTSGCNLFVLWGCEVCTFGACFVVLWLMTGATGLTLQTDRWAVHEDRSVASVDDEWGSCQVGLHNFFDGCLHSQDAAGGMGGSIRESEGP